MGCCESRDKDAKTEEKQASATVDLNTSKSKSAQKEQEQQDVDQMATQAQDEEQHHEEEQQEEAQEEEDFDATVLTIAEQGQKFDEAEDVADYLEKYRGHSQEVIEINLSGNSFGLGASKKIAEFFWEFNNCQRALLNNMFVSRKREELPEALQEMMNALDGKPIGELNLSDNAFGPDGVNAFRDFLVNSQYLTTLKLNNCGLGPEGAEILSQALIDRGEFLLTDLDLGRNRMKSEGGEHIAKYLDVFESLQTLTIPSNSIEEDGLIPLFNALTKHSANIKVLEINDNSVTGKSFKSLLNLIQSCEVLEIIDISDSNIAKRRRQRKLIKCFNESTCKNTITEFRWNYDIEQYQVSQELFEMLLSYPENLQKVDAVGLIKKRQNRVDLRQKFQERNVTIRLSMREIDPQSDDEEDSDSQSEDEESQESSSSSSSSNQEE